MQAVKLALYQKTCGMQHRIGLQTLDASHFRLSKGPKF